MVVSALMSAKAADAKGKESWQVMLETTDSKDKVTDYYKANMSGFTMASTMDMGTSAVRVYQSPKYQVSLMVGSESGGKTSISLSVTSSFPRRSPSPSSVRTGGSRAARWPRRRSLR